MDDPSRPFEGLAALDRLVHDPARLAILTALDSATEIDFLFLQRLTGLTKGNLSSHLSKLEEAGLARIEKGFVGKVPRTTIHPTERGLVAVDDHWRRLERLRGDALTWRATTGCVGAGDRASAAPARGRPAPAR